MPSLATVKRLKKHKAFRRRFAGPSSFGGDLPTVTFPSTRLTTRVWIALGADLTASYLTWNWLNITEWVRHDLGISVVDGRRDQSGRVTTSRCQLKIDNRDGRFARRNPHSPYYGLLGGKIANTPIWIERNAGNGFHDAYRGFVNSWPTNWTDPSGNDSYVVIECAGVMRRLEQGQNLDSPLNRTILADDPVAYWKLDDPATATLAASSLPNVATRMDIFQDEVEFAAVDGPPGAAGALAVGTPEGTLRAFVSTGPPWTIVYSVLRPSDGSADGNAVAVLTYIVDGVETSQSIGVSEDTDSTDRDWYHYLIVGIQNGASPELRIFRNGLARPVVTLPGTTLGAFVSLEIGQIVGPFLPGVAFSSAAIYGHANCDPVAHSGATQAFAGELAHVRAGRVAAELGVPFQTDATTSAAMGEQPSGTGMEILRETEAVDGGVLYEHGYGFRFQALSERYNQPVALELDFDQFHIYNLPQHADDDSRFRNQWTLRSSSTGVARTWLDPGYTDQDGLYDDGANVNTFEDDQLFFGAGWRVWRDSVDEDRWIRLPINLGGTPELIAGWTALQLGQRMTVANPPEQVAPDTIDAIVEGRSERWDTVSWVASPNTAPSRPYQVGVAGDSTTRGAWAQARGAELAADVDTTQTAITVTSTDTWASSPNGQLITFGGEVVSLDAVAGSAPNWTFTVTRSINGVTKAHSITGPAKLRAVKVHRAAVAVY